MAVTGVEDGDDDDASDDDDDDGDDGLLYFANLYFAN